VQPSWSEPGTTSTLYIPQPNSDGIYKGQPSAVGAVNSISSVGNSDSPSQTTSNNTTAHKPSTTVTNTNTHNTPVNYSPDVSILGMNASAAQSALIAFIVLFAMSTITAITLAVLYWRQRHNTPKIVV
jgi:hypothetical protein